MNRLFNITACLFIVLLGVIGVSLFYPFKPLIIYEPVKVLTKEVKPGDAIIVEFNFQKNTKIIPEISLALVDGIVYNIPSYRPQNIPGAVIGKKVAVMEVPNSIPCGTYHLHWTASYRYNTLRTVDVEYASEEFYISNTICVEENGNQ